MKKSVLELFILSNRVNLSGENFLFSLFPCISIRTLAKPFDSEAANRYLYL